MLRAHDAGDFTQPSAAQYPHQWNWDSAFNSLGWATIDWGRACREIESMLAGQWKNGLVPHIRYDPAAPAGYFPGPEWWPGAKGQVAQTGQLTSGLTNPPILVWAARLVGEAQTDPDLRLAFWRRILRALSAYVGYFPAHRRLPGSPLYVIVHPWESGMDNSPRWDLLREAGLRPSRPYSRLDQRGVDAAQRPTDRDYDAFMALVELWDGCGYDLSEYARRSPFAVYDVLLDAAWYRAANDLNFMAAALGEAMPVPAAELDEFRAAIEAVHWDGSASLYLDYDLRSAQLIQAPTPAGLAGLAAGAADPERARTSWDSYLRRCAGARLVPTVPPDDPRFDRSRYWRGPVWINVDWLVAEGLKAYGLNEAAAAVSRASLELVAGGAMGEYFDALSGDALGTIPFSWTAALTLVLLRNEAA